MDVVGPRTQMLSTNSISITNTFIRRHSLVTFIPLTQSVVHSFNVLAFQRGFLLSLSVLFVVMCCSFPRHCERPPPPDGSDPPSQIEVSASRRTSSRRCNGKIGWNIDDGAPSARRKIGKDQLVVALRKETHD